MCLQEWRNRDGSVSVETKGCLSSVQGAGERTSHHSPPQLFQHSRLLLSAAAARRRDKSFADGKRWSSSHSAFAIAAFWLKLNLNSQCSKAKRVRGSQTRALHKEPGATEDPALQTFRGELSPPYRLLHCRLWNCGRLVPGTVLL